MKLFANSIGSLMIAAWLIAIAVFSIQNIEPVSLQFLIWRSINFPLGVLLALCAGVGFVGGAFVPLLWQRK